MATLMQFWTGEVARLVTALGTQQLAVTALRLALQAAESDQRGVADAVLARTRAVDAARRALAGIAMPADGDPLLAEMENQLAALGEAQAALASGALALEGLRAELARQEQQQAALAAALQEAQATLLRETRAADSRTAMVDALTTGELATLAADAQNALTTHEPTARTRVESEFPTNATDSRNFLKRVRARRGIIEQALSAAGDVEDAAHAADHDALARAQRSFDAAVAAVRRTAEAAPRLAADTDTLARLAALPAPQAPNSFPILTRWQRERLHDPARKAAREAALQELTAVDTARVAVRTAQTAYDKALHAAMKAEPDKTVAQLDATTLATPRDTLDDRLQDLADARAALNATERGVLQHWFAAVPDTLWDALDSLDGAVARLTALQGPPTPATLITAMNNAEDALVTALAAARLAGRQRQGADTAWQRASGELAAERETVPQRARAFARSSALF